MRLVRDFPQVEPGNGTLRYEGGVSKWKEQEEQSVWNLAVREAWREIQGKAAVASAFCSFAFRGSDIREFSQALGTVLEERKF